MKLTQAQLNKLSYMDILIKEDKTDKQKLAIELSERDKRLKRRLQVTNSKPFEDKIYLNHLPWTFKEKWVDKTDVTPEMIEREEEMVDYIIND